MIVGSNELAAREWADVNEYADAKTEFISAIEHEARRVVGAAQADKSADQRAS
jgi:hypothetical protein